jgi:hypothetical protein
MMHRHTSPAPLTFDGEKAKRMMLLSVLLIALFTFLALPCCSWAAGARGHAYGEKLFLNGKPLGMGLHPCRSIFKEKTFLPSLLPPPPGVGAFRYIISKDFLAQGVEEGHWAPLSEPACCFIGDGALAYRVTCPARREVGTSLYRWRFTSPGGATATVVWKYRVFSKSYARLVARTDEGIERGVYGGEPVGSLDLTAGILLSYGLASLDDHVTETMLAGTWNVTEELQGEKERVFSFDLRVLALRNLTLVSPPESSSPAGGDPLIINATVVPLPAATTLFPRPWRPDTVTWRLIATRERRHGEMIIHKGWGQFPLDGPAGAREGILSHRWTGTIDGDPGPREEGRGRILVQALGKVEDRWVKSQVRELPYEVKGPPRISISDESGSILADSREGELLSLLRPADHDARAPAPIPGDITFIPAGNALLDAPSPRKTLKDFHFSHIFQKEADKDTKLLIEARGLPKEARESWILISSSLPGRSEIRLPLRKGSAGGAVSCTAVATSSEKEAASAIFVGSRRGEKSFAFLDLTYLEDTDMLKSILLARGWHSRGEMSSLTLREPFMVRSDLDFMRAGGYETLTFTCPDIPGQKAILHIKNQADLLYYGGHGWGNGYIALREGYLLPGDDMQKGDWGDNLKIVIFSTCSNLDIQNYNGRSFTAYGKIKDSPGIEWASVSGPQVALLGYNWSTQEGKPPHAFDTRVIRRFLSLWPRHAPPTAWIYANIIEGDSAAPCAIYQDHYYFIHNPTGRIIDVPGDSWRSGRLPAGCGTVPWPSR